MSFLGLVCSLLIFLPSIPKANTRSIYDQDNPPPDFSAETLARLAAMNLTPFQKKAQSLAEKIQIEKDRLSAGAKSQPSAADRTQSSDKELQPSNQGSQPLPEGIQRTNEKENVCLRKDEGKKEESSARCVLSIEFQPY